jgi:hypothetical protein
MDEAYRRRGRSLPVLRAKPTGFVKKAAVFMRAFSLAKP